ncbi:MAG: GcrA family cell cycle regulator [Paracoccaceae bacterium]
MSWTDERVEQLKQMWGEGKSASQISKELGSVTRNAVIGKVHRLGLSNRPATPATAPGKAAKDAAKPAAKAASKEPAATPAPKAAAPAQPAAAPASPPPPVAREHIPGRKPIGIPGQPLPPQPTNSEISAEALANVKALERKAKKLNLMQLTERTCKWPIGDPATPEFWFCGHPTEPGKPYCETHVGIAFQPMSSRRDRRR